MYLALIFPILIKYFPKCVGKGSFPKSQIKSLWLILRRAPTATLLRTLPGRQRAYEINCIWILINYELKYIPWWKYTKEKELKWTGRRACTHAHITHTLVLKVKKGLTETRTRIHEKKYLYLIRLALMYCCLPIELQRKLSKLLKVTYIIMIMYYVTPMIPLYNGFYLFPLSHAVNSNRLIFDPSEVEVHQ